jgi:hypothetical protein
MQEKAMRIRISGHAVTVLRLESSIKAQQEIVEDLQRRGEYTDLAERLLKRLKIALDRRTAPIDGNVSDA